MANKIWTIVYSDQNRSKLIGDLSKAEAKRIWGGLMESFGRNAVMSSECKEAYLQKNGHVMAFKNGDYWFVGDQMINGLYETKEEVLALI